MKKFEGRYPVTNKYIENKLVFLNDKDFSEYTQYSYFDLLYNNVNYVEVNKGKDLYEFTKDEILDLIKDSATNSQRSKRALFSAINSYINWTIENGINYIDNPCDDIDITEVTEVSKKAIASSYINMTDFRNTIEDIALFSSEAEIIIAILLRYGVTIEQMNSITWEDVDRDKMLLRVMSKCGKETFLPIDDYFVNWIDKAKECKEFEYEVETSNGRVFIKKIEFIDNGYVIKGTTRTKEINININTIHNRFNLLFSRSGNKRYRVGDLQKSRKFDLLFDKLKENNNKLTYSDVSEVNHIFVPDATAANNNLIKNDFEKIANIKVTRVRK